MLQALVRVTLESDSAILTGFPRPFGMLPRILVGSIRFCDCIVDP